MRFISQEPVSNPRFHDGNKKCTLIAHNECTNLNLAHILTLWSGTDKGMQERHRFYWDTKPALSISATFSACARAQLNVEYKSRIVLKRIAKLNILKCKVFGLDKRQLSYRNKKNMYVCISSYSGDRSGILIIFY